MLEQSFVGQTVEAAIQQGLQKLNVTEAQVKIEVIQQNKKGLFGFGQRDAEVKLTVIDPLLKKQVQEERVVQEFSSEIFESQLPSKSSDNKERLLESAEATASYIERIVQQMGITAKTSSEIKGTDVLVTIESDQPARIIGKRGQNLNALQTLAQAYIQNVQKSYAVVTLDIEGYRKKRKETLETLALNMAEKTKKTNHPVKFEPMPNYERKIMHQILAKIDDVETYSEGREPHRYLVIKSK